MRMRFSRRPLDDSPDFLGSVFVTFHTKEVGSLLEPMALVPNVSVLQLPLYYRLLTLIRSLNLKFVLCKSKDTVIEKCPVYVFKRQSYKMFIKPSRLNSRKIPYLVTSTYTVSVQPVDLSMC